MCSELVIYTQYSAVFQNILLKKAIVIGAQVLVTNTRILKMTKVVSAPSSYGFDKLAHRQTSMSNI